MFTEIVYKPLFNLIVYLHNIAPQHDFGVVIIVLALLVRAIFYPMTKKTLNVQKQMTKIQPEVKRIQQQYKNNKQEQGQRLMALYKEHKVNPMSGCLPLLVQLPIMVGLYQILRKDILSQSNLLYPSMHIIGEPNYTFLGIVDLTAPNLFLALAAGLTQYFSMQTSGMPTSTKKEDRFSFQNQMRYISPVLTFFIAMKLSSGLAFFWAMTNGFTILQQVFNNYQSKKHEQRNA
jgi:YidC/Oxa1 family membrane protein insertase